MKVEPPSHKIAIFWREDARYGALALSIHPAGTVLGLCDEKKDIRQSPCQSPAVGRELFENTLRTNEKNGFHIGFLGSPNNAGLS